MKNIFKKPGGTAHRRPELRILPLFFHDLTDPIRHCGLKFEVFTIPPMTFTIKKTLTLIARSKGLFLTAADVTECCQSDGERPSRAQGGRVGEMIGERPKTGENKGFLGMILEKYHAAFAFNVAAPGARVCDPQQLEILNDDLPSCDSREHFFKVFDLSNTPVRRLKFPRKDNLVRASSPRLLSIIQCLLFASLWLIQACHADTYDVVIHGGRIVDGSGNPAYFADIGVQNGKIVKIGHITDPAMTVIDATHLVVAPGFIDVHTHADDVAEHPRAENFIRMGVTSIVVGNCGSSTLNVGEFFRDLERVHVALNVATLIGHNDVREKAMGGIYDRPPTDAEMAEMKAIVDQGMKDGAVGLSTGLIYLPGTFAKTDEIVELAKVISPYDGIYTSHMRHENAQIFEGLDEVFRVAREAHVRAEVSHIKLSGENCWGEADKVLAYIEKARAAGLDITQDQYAYTASSTTLRQLIPDEAFDGGDKTFLKFMADPDKRAALAAEMKASLRQRHRDDFGYAVIAEYRHDKSLDGLNIVEAAKKLHDSDSLDAQIETIFEIQTNGSGSGVFHGMDEPDLQKFMQHPNTMIACDSGIRIFGEGVPHPRGYGNNARVLGRYVRELHTLRLEDAVRKMTSLPANTFQFDHRGELRVGNWADITIFDPERIQDTATYTDPHHYPLGIPDVLVNGVPVIKDGEDTGATPGMALRHVVN